MTEQHNLNEDVKRFETGLNGQQLTSQGVQTEVQRIHDSFKKNDGTFDQTGYQTYINQVYRQIHGDAANGGANSHLAELLPQIDLVDRSLNSTADVANFTDGLNYGTATPGGKTWTSPDGTSGMTMSHDGQAITSFNPGADGRVNVTTIQPGKPANSFEYPPGTKFKPNEDGSVGITFADNTTGQIRSDGTEVVKTKSGNEVTRSGPGGDITAVTLSNTDAKKGPVGTLEVGKNNVSALAIDAQGNPTKITWHHDGQQDVTYTHDGGFQVYRQGDCTIRLKDGETQWYAQQGSGSSVKVEAPWKEGIASGIIRSAGGNHSYNLDAAKGPSEF